MTHAALTRRVSGQARFGLIVATGISVFASASHATTAVTHKLPIAALQALILSKTRPATSATAVTISTKATKNMSCSGGVCTPTGKKPVLNVSELTRMLADSNVVVGTNGATPDIIVAASFSWVSANGLTLQAIHSIAVNKAISDAGPGALTLVDNADGSGGALSFGNAGKITFLGLSNPLRINGTAFTLVNSVHMLAQMVENNPSGNYALAVSYNAKQDGKYAQSPIPVPFGGIFEGLGNEINHLDVEDQNGGDQDTGFFQHTTPTALVQDLKLKIAVINGYLVVGGFVADNEGTLFQDSISGTVTVSGTNGEKCIAGTLAGMNSGKIGLSHGAGAVSDSTTCSLSWIGGLVGTNVGLVIVSDASATASVLTPGSGWAGGLVGENDGEISYSSSTGAAAATAKSEVGGLVGLDSGTITNSSATGAATVGDSGAAGGLVGRAEHGAIDTSTSEGAVSGGNSSNVGGAIGVSIVSSISSCTSYGAVTGGGSGGWIGGFVGFDDGEVTFVSDFWDVTTSGFTDIHHGAGNVVDDPGITPFY